MTRLQDAYTSGAVSPLEATQSCLERISSLDPTLHAFLLTREDEATAEAQRTGRQLAAGHAAPVGGVPYSLKDNFDVAGLPTTCHSRPRRHDLAHSDSDACAALKQADAVLLGKNSMHELATGGPCFDLPWPPARNPWDISRHPGGSSSGSGVAVATGMSFFALGTDTGGSVRHPATACGIFGFKPSFGAISTQGVVPLSRSLDHPGVLTRSATDVACVMAVIAADPAERQSYLQLVHTRSDQRLAIASLRSVRKLRDYRIGVIDAFSTDLQADPEITAAFDEMLNRLTLAGCHITRLQVDSLERYKTANSMMIAAEAYTYHGEQIEAHPEQYSARTVARISAGKRVTTQQYVGLRDNQRALTMQLNGALGSVDVAMALSSLYFPCGIDDTNLVDVTYDQHARTPFNLTGLPAIAVPAGLSSMGLPLGVQFAASAGGDTRLIEFCMALEAAGLSSFIPPPEIVAVSPSNT